MICHDIDKINNVIIIVALANLVIGLLVGYLIDKRRSSSSR